MAVPSAAPPTVIHDTRIVHHTEVVQVWHGRTRGLAIGAAGLLARGEGSDHPLLVTPTATGAAAAWRF